MKMSYGRAGNVDFGREVIRTSCPYLEKAEGDPLNMLIHRELIISRKNLQEKSYAPQQTTNKEIEELAPSEKEEFLLPAVELLYSIYKEGGFGPDADDKEDRDLC